MTEQAKILYEKIRGVIARVQFQPGYPKWAELNPPKDKDGNYVTPPLEAKPGASKTTTWCNEAANAILTELGFDTKPILNPKGIGWTYSTAMVDNAARCAALAGTAGGCGVYEVSPRQAQAWANLGVPVLAASNDPAGKQPGHLGVVAPTDDGWDPKAGPWVGQAGAKNGFRSAYDSFTRWGLNPPRFYLLPLKV